MSGKKQQEKKRGTKIIIKIKHTPNRTFRTITNLCASKYPVSKGRKQKLEELPEDIDKYPITKEEFSAPPQYQIDQVVRT